MQKITRRCKTEGCARLCTKHGSKGLCSLCYTRLRKKRKPEPATETDRPCASRELELVLPVRRRFEWTGNLQESLARISVPEEK